MAPAPFADKGAGSRRSAPPNLLAPLLLLLAGPLLPAPVGAQALPPDIPWRTITTEHFHVTYPAALDSLGRVAAARSEQAWATLAAGFVEPPDGHIELVLTDHADFSNGSARVAPYPRIIVYARPPVDGFALSHFDDWLEVVITHELVHVFHLDTGGPLSDVLRALFGRVPSRWPFFPGGAAPGWIVEGLATWQESALTESGRVRGTQHDMALHTAALEGAFEDIGQASGETPLWPAGSRRYIYGAAFFDWLARTYGDRAVGDFVRVVGGQWIPYRLNAAAREAFGASFSEAWRAWEASEEAELEALRARLAAHAPITEPLAVTEGARQAYYAQASPDGARVLYARSDGHDDTHLRLIDPDGGEDEELTRTNGTSVFSWTPDGRVLFAQLRFDGPYVIRSDLHLADADGDVRRLTDGARLDHPSAAPDGRTAVAVQYAPGRSALVEVDLETGGVRPLATDDPAAQWSFPRVSPDGRWIAASRWRPGAFFDVVILERSGRLAFEVTSDRAMDVAPAWSPDGRWLVWGSDRNGVPNVMGAAVDPATGRPGAVRQVTNVLTGAAFPSVDAGARWIYFSGYHADGWEIERVPFDPASWVAPPPLDPRFRAETPWRAPADPGPLQERAYSPWRTLRPRYWEIEGRSALTAGGREVIGQSFGFRTSGDDLVGRHGVDAFAALSTTGELDASLSYRWAGLGNPVLGVAGEQLWDASGPLRGERQDGTVDTLFVTERERELSGFVTHRVPGFRAALSTTLTGGVVWEERELLGRDLEPSTTFRLDSPSARLADVRASFSLSTARAHAFSIGPAEGVALVLQARRRAQLDLADSLSGVAGADRSYDELVGRVEAYQSFPGPGFADHVLAFRGSAGVAGGPAAGAGHFGVGGASGTREPVTGLSLFGASSFLFPLRGYPSGARRGRYAGAASAEYRFPIALLHRGLGLFPLYFDQMSGALFADAGNAWGGGVGEENPKGDPLASAGAELLVDLLTFYDITVRLRAGVAVPLVERVSGAGLGPQAYLRFGRSF